MMSPEVITAFISATVALTTSFLGLVVNAWLTDRKMRQDYRLEFAAERVIRLFLLEAEHGVRSFETIKKHLGGFGDEELRKLLVAAGAIRFKNAAGHEVWGLIERNLKRLKSEPKNKDMES